jgi:hypothetical protein
MGWQDDARRTVVSDKKMLSTLEGYWVKLRKWSISAKDEIDQATSEAQKDISKKALFDIAKKVKGIEPEKLKSMKNEEIMEILDADDLMALSAQASVASAKVIEAKLKHGIDSHNFCDGDIDTRSTDKDIKGFASQIILYPEIAYEVLAMVEDFNRPLVSQTSNRSGMSLNGYTTEPNLNTVTSSQMG